MKSTYKTNPLSNLGTILFSVLLRDLNCVSFSSPLPLKKVNGGAGG